MFSKDWAAGVIESSMIFGLGFLIATLAALLVVPALNARAERLARRRIEAMFPLSLTELTAEKDHLRAEFAVLQRRIERKAEDAQAGRQASMEDLGRRIREIEALSAELTERKAHIAEVEAGLAEAQAGLTAATDDLSVVRGDLTTTREHLAALDEAHRTVVAEFSAAKNGFEANTVEITRLRADMEATLATLAARDAALADLRTRHEAALADNDTKRITVADLETRLSAMTMRAKELDRSLNETRSELTAERHRSTEMARSLVAEQDRGVALESRARKLVAERDARAGAVTAAAAATANAEAARDEMLAQAKEHKAEIEAVRRELTQARLRIELLEGREQNRDREHAGRMKTLEEQIEVLKAEKASIEGALASARRDRSRAEADLKALKRQADAATDGVRAENADLSRRLDELADHILALGAGDHAKAAEAAAPLELGGRERRSVRA